MWTVKVTSNASVPRDGLVRLTQIFLRQLNGLINASLIIPQEQLVGKWPPSDNQANA